MIIGGACSFRLWGMHGDKGIHETPAAAKLFWVNYLKKLKTSYDRLRHGGSPNAQFHAELFEFSSQDFFAHFFDCDQPGGHAGQDVVCRMGTQHQQVPIELHQ